MTWIGEPLIQKLINMRIINARMCLDAYARDKALEALARKLSGGYAIQLAHGQGQTFSEEGGQPKMRPFDHNLVVQVAVPMEAREVEFWQEFTRLFACPAAEAIRKATSDVASLITCEDTFPVLISDVWKFNDTRGQHLVHFDIEMHIGIHALGNSV